ncbi:hypothetical protein K438DRAFT_1772079 [Mycena galopus ATCC 62051]|nr:hypothetical protein K438DRAFT_1772079 [Mycena galopus ATCC 62051]
MSPQYKLPELLALRLQLRVVMCGSLLSCALLTCLSLALPAPTRAGKSTANIIFSAPTPTQDYVLGVRKYEVGGDPPESGKGRGAADGGSAGSASMTQGCMA